MTSPTLSTLHYLARTFKQRLRVWLRDLPRWRDFWVSYREYRQLLSPAQQAESMVITPYIRDKTAETPIDVVYFYQDAWAFERIVHNAPPWHIDVGSHHKFVALLSKVVPVTMVDIRPLPVPLESLEFKEGSILDMPYETDSVPSISSICVVEHIGLGRYGDPLDPNGSAAAFNELKRILAPGGRLYISVPVGDENTTYFNAARVFRLDHLIAMLDPLVVAGQKFIVGRSFQDDYEATPMWGTTALLELTKPAGSDTASEFRS